MRAPLGGVEPTSLAPLTWLSISIDLFAMNALLTTRFILIEVQQIVVEVGHGFMIVHMIVEGGYPFPSTFRFLSLVFLLSKAVRFGFLH
jgi:hypothetical protein